MQSLPARDMVAGHTISEEHSESEANMESVILRSSELRSPSISAETLTDSTRSGDTGDAYRRRNDDRGGVLTSAGTWAVMAVDPVCGIPASRRGSIQVSIQGRSFASARATAKRHAIPHLNRTRASRHRPNETTRVTPSVTRVGFSKLRLMRRSSAGRGEHPQPLHGCRLPRFH